MGRKRKQRAHVNLQQCPALQVIHSGGKMDVYLKMPDNTCIGVVYDNQPMHTRLVQTLGVLHKRNQQSGHPYARFREEELRQWSGTQRVHAITFRWNTYTGEPA